MTAEEMFRAKDFVPFFETPALFVYESFSERDIDRIDIAFYKYDKKFLVYYVDRDDPVEIDMPLLKAINKQIEEYISLLKDFIKFPRNKQQNGLVVNPGINLKKNI